MTLERICALLLFLAVSATGLPIPASTSPLDAFGELVVGEWEAEDSRHVLEWGVGQRVIRSRSYHKSDEGWTLVGEGMWFWDAKQSSIRGVVVAIGMPVDLFDYRSEVRDGEIVHNLVAQGAAGGEYVERWVFADKKYRWSLEVQNKGEAEAIMGGAYQRVGKRR
jgi:hypothetical protein